VAFEFKRSGLSAQGLLAALLIAIGSAGLSGCGSMSGLETRARILSEPPCTDFFFPIYFARRSAELTKAAQGVIANAGGHAKGCTIAQVQVIGLADYRRPANDALALSRDRARRLDDALRAAGLPDPTYQLSPLGDAAPAPRPTIGPEPRRADVFIRFQH